MDIAVVRRFIALYGKRPTLKEYVQYEPYFFVKEFSYREYLLLTASPHADA